MSWLRRRRDRRHDPAPSLPPASVAGPPAEAPTPAAGRWQPWEPIARKFASRVLLLTYSASSSLAEVEGSEQDADQLQRLYRTDHAITRIRRWAENLQVLAGVQVDDPGRIGTTITSGLRLTISLAMSA